LAPFFLAMKRGIDLLLSLEHADPARVAVHGLSGGGWQTIFISGLDPRVTLSNPVAGYSSYRTRLRHFKDLGDSEQTPSDLATVVDYAHLTAMRAPRPTLLTFNAKDPCCFEAGYALKPLEDAARPVFELFGRGDALRTHVNHDPGDHNYGLDNRQALYRITADVFRVGKPEEIPSDGEVKSADVLEVPVPADNATFNSLARELAKRSPNMPSMPFGGVHEWQSENRTKLRDLLRMKDWTVAAEKLHESPQAVYWKVKVGDAFTVPCVEVPGKGSPILLFGEGGRAALAKEAGERSSEGRPVLVLDPFFYGESKLGRHDFLLALLAAAVGQRALGIQASQVAAVARWARERHGTAVEVDAVGPRAGLAALCAAAVELKAVGALTLRRPYGSLKELIEQNVGVNKAPEPFAFGLLESFDVALLTGLAAPRPVRLRGASERARQDLAVAKGWYVSHGADPALLRLDDP
ncbi:MAG TPA: hypothetical protein VEJ18_18965, partial [Planctomycetota bacterium]|nr:hypothetical protein [Planctomycetota bacterium]